jgi:hypothetical protein
VDNLVVNSHLLTIIVDDEDADAATAVVEGVGETLEKVALVKDREALLDIARLGHGDDAAILADVENTVLLEDRTKHVLDDDGRARVGDEAGLLMELLGEEVNTEVTVLAGLGRGGDADDLARAALEDQEIANADVVAGDGDGVGRRSHGARWGSEAGLLDRDGGSCVSRGGGARSVGNRGGVRAGRGNVDGSVNRSRGRYRSGSGILLLDYNFLTVVAVGRADVGVGVRVVVAGSVDGVSDAFSYFLGSSVKTVAE